MLKRVILSLLALIILTHSVFVPVAHAQSPWYSQSFPDWYTKVYDTNFSPSSEIFGERYTAAQVQWVIWGLVSFFMNLPTPDHPEIWAGVMSGNIAQSIQGISTVFSDLTSYIPPTQQGPTQTLLATLLSNPVSGLGYFKNLVSRLGIVKPAYAQGFGYTALNPIQTVWISFRNIIYGFFIIFIIVYAFMIMFRRKISPQAAVTIQSALPKLIVTLVLVTFSYAIAGFMIDLMYVLIGLVAWIAGQSIISSALSWSQVFTILTQGPTVGPISTGFVGIAFVYFITTLLTFLITFVGGFTSIWNGAQVTLAFAVLGLPATILLIFALIYITFKVFWVLLKTFINIMLLIIFSPVYIGLGALDLPGVGFGAWAKELAANLLVYPTVGLLVVLSFFFLFVAAVPLMVINAGESTMMGINFGLYYPLF